MFAETAGCADDVVVYTGFPVLTVLLGDTDKGDTLFRSYRRSKR